MTEDHAERGMVAKPMLEDFFAAISGGRIYLQCPDDDCEWPRTTAGMAWTIREQIDAATEHNRKYHS